MYVYIHIHTYGKDLDAVKHSYYYEPRVFSFLYSINQMCEQIYFN